MTASDPENPDRFRLLATFIAGRSVDIAEAPAGEPAHTNGQVIFVSAGRSVAEQRREMLVQSALLGAGSLDQRLVKALRARPTVARRYLALEGRRVLAELAETGSTRSRACPDGEPSTATADAVTRDGQGPSESRRSTGVVRRHQTLPAADACRRTGRAGHRQGSALGVRPIDLPEADDDDDDGEQSGESKILKLFETPLFNSQALSDFLRKLLGSSRSPGDDAAGGRVAGSAPFGGRTQVGPNARPLPTRIRFTDDGKPGAAIGVGGALYPEWDVHNNRYRPEWCRVIDFPLTVAADVSAAGVPRDDVLRRRLSRVGLGPKVLRGRPDGDELDIEALIDLFVDLRSGYSPPEHVYLERRKLARNLGVLILLDASGSATDTDPDGLAVHDHQRRAAATLAATLEELGDRVAVYAFRSQGRHAVHLPAIKTFGQRFGAVGRARLNQLQPSGYTRLGAGIRGAGEILKTRGRHAESAAGRPVGRLSLRRRLRGPLRGGRRLEGPRRAPHGRRCLPVSFHRRRHRHRCARTRLRFRRAMPAPRRWPS